MALHTKKELFVLYKTKCTSFNIFSVVSFLSTLKSEINDGKNENKVVQVYNLKIMQ